MDNIYQSINTLVPQDLFTKSRTAKHSKSSLIIGVLALDIHSILRSTLSTELPILEV